MVAVQEQQWPMVPVQGLVLAQEQEMDQRERVALVGTAVLVVLVPEKVTVLVKALVTAPGRPAKEPEKEKVMVLAPARETAPEKKIHSRGSKPMVEKSISKLARLSLHSRKQIPGPQRFFQTHISARRKS